MKKINLISCLLVILTAFSTTLFGQLDPDRKSEMRLAMFGHAPLTVNIDNYGVENNSFYNPTLSYLRKLNEKQWFFVGEVSGGARQLYKSQDGFEQLEDEGWNRFAQLFLGLEKQHQFKHIAVFYSGGINGGYSRFNGDFNQNSEAPLLDLQLDQFKVGLSGRLTFITNISDNIYLYLHSSLNLFYLNQDFNVNPQFGNCCRDNTGFDFSMNLLESVGVAYKLPNKK